MEDRAVVPSLAATLMLVRDGAAGLEVLMLTRTDRAGFAAGAMVFPGGQVDAGDRALLPLCAPTPGLDDADLTLRAAAIRETFEECGILLAWRGGTLIDADALEPLRPGLRADFARGLAEADLKLATDLLVRFAHWITPPDSRRRFDTHFLLAPAPAGQAAIHDGAEMVAAAWVAPAEILARADSDGARVMFPTYMNTRKLGASTTVAEALAAARAARVATVTPESIRTDAGTLLRIPADAGYDRTEMPARPRG